MPRIYRFFRDYMYNDAIKCTQPLHRQKHTIYKLKKKKMRRITGIVAA